MLTGPLVTEPNAPVILNAQFFLNPGEDDSIASIAWMLSQPFLATNFETGLTDDVTQISTLFFPTVLETNSWANIALSMFTFVNRKNATTLLLAKTVQPHKLLFEMLGACNPLSTLGNPTDRFKWRNQTIEHDVTARRVIQLLPLSANMNHSKLNSLFPPIAFTGDINSVFENYNIIPGWFTNYDGSIVVYSIQPVQSGSIYVRNYTTYVFMSMAGSVVYSPVSPSFCAVLYGAADGSTSTDITRCKIVERSIIGQI